LNDDVSIDELREAVLDAYRGPRPPGTSFQRSRT
jgi:hypothetical protein